MSDQTQLVQDVEQALDNAGITHELQSVDVRDSMVSTDDVTPIVVDIELRVHRT